MPADTHVSDLLVADGCGDLLNLQPSNPRSEPVPAFNWLAAAITYIVPCSSALAGGARCALVLCLLDGSLNSCRLLQVPASSAARQPLVPLEWHVVPFCKPG
jgi:hypothetical protein